MVVRIALLGAALIVSFYAIETLGTLTGFFIALAMGLAIGIVTGLMED